MKWSAVSSAPVCTGVKLFVKMWDIARAISSAVTLCFAGSGHNLLSKGVMETMFSAAILVFWLTPARIKGIVDVNS